MFLDTGNWIPFYLILTTIFIVAVQQRKRIIHTAIMKVKRKKGSVIMPSDAFKQHIGRRCQIMTMLEKKITGVIKRVDGSWVEIETKKSIVIVNAEFIERLSVIS